MSGDGKAVYVVGTFDTKGAELDYVAGLLSAAGLRVVRVDISTQGRGAAAEVTADALAAHHPDGASAVFEAGDRGLAVTAMGEALRLYIASREDLGGIIGLGGSGGTTMIAPAMRALAIGTPKVLVSTLAAGDVSPYVGLTDITMVFPVTDIAGLNRLSRKVLANAAHALAGMLLNPVPEKADERPALAVSMFGVTTACVLELNRLLEDRYDCLVFHATGKGGLALESLVDAGLVAAVVDVTTTEAADHLLGGVCTAGPHRFEACARTGTPWIGSLGAIDMVNFWGPETVPPRYAGRHFHVHNANVTLMRTTPEENTAIGTWIAGKLNRHDGIVRLLIPEGGVSALDAAGQAFHDPVADAALFDAIEKTLVQTARRRLIRLPLHINDPRFAEALAAETRDALGDTGAAATA
jgi:uncharacterized protein (UPF0261 family)